MLVTSQLLTPNDLTSKHVFWARVEKDGSNLNNNCIIRFNSNNTIQYKRVIRITKTRLVLDSPIDMWDNINSIGYTHGRRIHVLTYNILS